MSDLEDFIKSYENKLSPGKRSVLEPYKDEILKMKQLGFTEKLILQFLAEKKNVSVSQQALNRFIRSRLQKMNLGAEKMVEKSQNDNKLINSKSPVSEPEKQKETLAQSTSGKNKFDWQNQINPEDYK
ncbi:hypothetical protein M5P25_02925 [Neisseria perflava]|jgi:hypothetical protein|uniref:hypothetical protein n=1 Tax=Neisseria perflava TaxID=33053 RepID=UPI00201B007A|nr:hypothetical protein [Neisseria perflava]MCL5078145.1 hypothetical protein [Neisseria perflava]